MKTLVEHVRTPPAPPSERTDLPIPAALEQLVLECLETEPERRPSSARELADRLAACTVGSRWTEAMAQRWWEQIEPMTGTIPTERTTPE